MKNNFITSLCVLFLIPTIATAQENVETAHQATDAERESVNTQAEAIRFDIWEYRVAGNTLIEQAMLERALIPYLGPGRTSSVINDAADALEKLYRDQGYPAVFVDIPEQNVIGGVVKLQITEGTISRLRITGADYFTLSGLTEMVPSLHTGQTIHMPTVQAEIQKLHSYSTDLQAVPILKAGREPGTMEIELRVKDELPLHGHIELNNHYSANTTELRLEGSISYDNLWQKFHSLKLLGQVSPEDTDEVRVLVANYIMPVNHDRNRLAVYYVKSDSDIATVGGLAVIGKGDIVGARYVIPLPGSQALNHATTLGFDFKDVEDVVDVVGGEPLKTPIQYFVANAAYNATAYAEDSTTRYTAGVNLGIRGPNSRDEFEDKRFKANPDFIYFRGEINRTDMLPADVDVVTSVKLQLTDSPLVSNEQFSAGGYLTVRGYLESQVLGDNAIAAGIELLSPRLFKSATGSYRTRLLTFLEGASVKTLEPLPGQDEHNELASTGVGLRVTKSKQLTIKLDWAYPLRDAGNEASGNLVRKGDSRAVFSLAYSF